MAVSEFTIPDRGLIRPFTPATGVYLAITLDPEATVQHLQDPIATQEAKAIATSVYIGFVSHRVDLVSPDRAYHLCDCHIVSRGLPVSADPSDGLDETMCLGIGPSQHPEGRKSVNPQPPLPWSNLYHHTVPDIRIRLRTQPGDYTKCSLVTWKDLNELLFWSEMDGSRRSDAVNNYFAAHPEDPRAQTRLKRAPERLGRPYLSPYLVSGAFDSSSISGGSSDASDTAATGLLGSSHADSDMSGFYVGSAKTRPLPGNLQGDPIAQQLFGYDSPYNRFVPLASFNMDITSDLEFSSADSFLREAREIKRIMIESEERRRRSHELTLAAVDAVPEELAVTEDSHRSHAVPPTEPDKSTPNVVPTPSPKPLKRKFISRLFVIATLGCLRQRPDLSISASLKNSASTSQAESFIKSEPSD